MCYDRKELVADMRKVKLTKDAIEGLLDNLLKRSPNNYGQYVDAVNSIVEDVRMNGDTAVFALTKKFDGADLNSDNIRVSQEEIEAGKKDGFVSIASEKCGKIHPEGFWKKIKIWGYFVETSKSPTDSYDQENG